LVWAEASWPSSFAAQLGPPIKSDPDAAAELIFRLATSIMPAPRGPILLDSPDDLRTVARAYLVPLLHVPAPAARQAPRLAAGRRPLVAQGSDRIAEEQAALRRVATRVAAAAAPEEVFAAVAAEVGRLLQVDYAILSRFEPDRVASVVGS
jgi:hypothetical protein